MKYYIAISKTTRGYIIMCDDCQYYWYYHGLPTHLDLTMFRRDTPDYTIERWLSKLESNGMQLLASFDDYNVFKRDFPEYFI